MEEFFNKVFLLIGTYPIQSVAVVAIILAIVIGIKAKK